MGFAGYKAGMTHIAHIEKQQNSPYKDQEIFCPVTVLEAPALQVYGVRLYTRTNQGLKAAGEAMAQNYIDNKYMQRKLTTPKEFNAAAGLKNVEDLVSSGKIVEVRALCATQPHLSSVPKKKPDLFEIKIGGSDAKEAFDFIQNYLGKELRAFDVLKEGQHVDVIAVSKGKGFQGPVKRFGVHILQHKSRKSKRAVACLGPQHPYRIMWTVPRAGQLGFHQRVEYNKQIMKLSEKGEEITPNGGFIRYGVVKGDYILIKGSVPGSKKRLVRLRMTIRGERKIEAPEITYVNLVSQQIK